MSLATPQFDVRDIAPTPARAALPVADQARTRRGQREAFERGAMGAGEMEVWKYVRPDGQLYHYVESPKEPGRQVRIPSTYPGTFTPGQRVQVGISRGGQVILGHPPGGQRGASQTTVESRSGTIDLLSVDRGVEFPVVAGKTEDHTLYGYGFRESPVDTFEPRKYDPDHVDADDDGWAPFTEITFSSVTWVSSTEVTVTVTASSTAPVGAQIGVYYARSANASEPLI